MKLGRAGLTLGGLLCLALMIPSFLALLGYASVGSPATVGDLIAARSHGTQLMLAFGGVGLVSGGLLLAYGHSLKHATPYLTALSAALMTISVVTGIGFKIAFHDADYEPKLKISSMAPSLDDWDDVATEAYTPVFQERLQVPYTDEELGAMFPDVSKEDVDEELDGNYRYAGKPLVVGDYILRQEGMSYVCAYESEEDLEDRAYTNCVRMDRGLEAYRGADTTDVEGEPATAYAAAAGLVGPLALLLAFSGAPAAQRKSREQEAEEQELLKARWEIASGKVGEVTLAWGNLSSDPLSALDHSALLDSSQLRTKTFILALAEASDFRSITKKKALTPERVERFEKLALEATHSWDEALSYSSRVGTSWMSAEEQKLAKTIRGVLELALDESNTPEARVSYAEKASQLLKKLTSVKMPEPTSRKLETIVRKELGAGSS